MRGDALHGVELFLTYRFPSSGSSTPMCLILLYRNNKKCQRTGTMTQVGDIGNHDSGDKGKRGLD